MSLPGPEDAFTIARHGEVLVVTASPVLRNMDSSLVDGAAMIILEPLQELASPLVTIDLSHLPAFGTAFLALLIRCWKQISQKSGTLALAGPSTDVRALLKITRFDTIWPIYASVPEAVSALLDD